MPIKQSKLFTEADTAFTLRDENAFLYEDCYEYMLPFRNTFNRDSTNSHNTPSKMYDSTAMSSASNFVNTMQENFTPVWQQWVTLKAGPAIPEKDRADWNEHLGNMMDKVFGYIQASNFSTAVAETYFDWGVGTGSLWLHEGDENNPLNYISAPASQFALSEGRFGTVDNRFRKHHVKAKLIKHTWPNADISFSSELQNTVQNNPNELVELVESCYYDYTELLWYYEVHHRKSEHMLLRMEIQEEMCFTPRWMKVAGNPWGFGPFILALADVRTLNKMKEYMLRNAALAVFGVYTVASNGGFNPNAIRIAPNSFIPVERNGGPNGPSIQALERAGSLDMQEFMMRDLRDSIKKTMLDNRLPDQQAQPATAFEIAERIKEFQQDTGTAYGRSMFEFVRPNIKRAIGILKRKGMLRGFEDIEIDDFNVQVQVTSPIAQLESFKEVEKFMQAYQMTAGISPQLAMMAYEIEKFPEWLIGKIDGPNELLRSDIKPDQIKDVLLNLAGAQLQGANVAVDQGAG